MDFYMKHNQSSETTTKSGLAILAKKNFKHLFFLPLFCHSQ